MSGKTWKETVAERRDTRADSSQPADQRIRKRKPNRKKWCRGKVGVEHKPACRDYGDVKAHIGSRGTTTGKMYYEGWKVLVCEECGKELELWMPWWSKDKEPPEWARETSK